MIIIIYYTCKLNFSKIILVKLQLIKLLIIIIKYDIYFNQIEVLNV